MEHRNELLDRREFNGLCSPRLVVPAAGSASVWMRGVPMGIITEQSGNADTRMASICFKEVTGASIRI
jgi:hypothetical protein